MRAILIAALLVAGVAVVPPQALAQGAGGGAAAGGATGGRYWRLDQPRDGRREPRNFSYSSAADAACATDEPGRDLARAGPASRHAWSPQLVGNERDGCGRQSGKIVAISSSRSASAGPRL